jgi:hypothetical protein
MLGEFDEKILDEVLKPSTEKIPGLGYVATILTVWTGSLTIFPPESTEFRGIAISLAAVILSVAMYRIGGILDGWLFDPVFAPDPGDLHPVRRRIWLVARPIREGAVELAAARERATRNLQLPVAGIYSESALMFKRTGAWEKRVKVPLEISKAARTFVLPLLFVTLYELAGSPWGRIAGHVRPAFLASPLLPQVILILVTNIYVRLRLWHMEELYMLAGSTREGRPGHFDNVRMFQLSEKILKDRSVTYRWYFSREQRMP